MHYEAVVFHVERERLVYGSQLALVSNAGTSVGSTSIGSYHALTTPCFSVDDYGRPSG